MSVPDTQNLVKYVSHLARMELDPGELEKLSRQLESILGFIAKLNEVDTKEVVPTSHILPISNVLRDDLPRQSLPPQKALENAPSSQEQCFSVPKIIE